MIRCSMWEHRVASGEGSMWTIRCCQDGEEYRAQVICYPGGGRCFGYVWTPKWVEMTHGPNFRRTAIKLLSALRRRTR